MLIQVIRKDNHYDYVQDFILDKLIESKEVAKFKRSTGWVTIGTHQIRGHNRERAGDVDRRSVHDSKFTREYRKAYLSSLEPF